MSPYELRAMHARAAAKLAAIPAAPPKRPWRKLMDPRQEERLQRMAKPPEVRKEHSRRANRARERKREVLKRIMTGE